MRIFATVACVVAVLAWRLLRAEEEVATYAIRDIEAARGRLPARSAFGR